MINMILSNVSFISQHLIATETRLQGQYQVIQSNMTKWWCKAKALSFEKLQAALNCGVLRRQVELIQRIKSDRYLYSTQQWTEHMLLLHFDTDAVYVQLKQQLVRLQRVESFSSASELSLKDCLEGFDFVPHSIETTCQLEDCLKKDRQFQKQKFLRHVADLVYRLGADLTPCKDEFEEIKTQMAMYLLSRFHLSESNSQTAAIVYLRARIGILDRPSSYNQAANP